MKQLYPVFFFTDPQIPHFLTSRDLWGGSAVLKIVGSARGSAEKLKFYGDLRFLSRDLRGDLQKNENFGDLQGDLLVENRGDLWGSACLNVAGSVGDTVHMIYLLCLMIS